MVSTVFYLIQVIKDLSSKIMNYHNHKKKYDKIILKKHIIALIDLILKQIVKNI